MKYNKDRVEETVLALLYLTSSHDQYGTRAWKGFDVGVLERLFEKGYISDPQIKSPTVVLSEEGAKLSKEFFFKVFGTN
jgi:hypothetical protein